MITITVDENSAEKSKYYANQAKDSADDAKNALPLDSISPVEIPDGVGLKSWNAVAPGSYPNCGGIVIPENCFAIIKRSASGFFSFSKTNIELGAYAKKIDLENVNVDLTGYEKKSDVLAKYAQIKVSIGVNEPIIVLDQVGKSSSGASGECILDSSAESFGIVKKIRVIPSSTSITINIVEWNGLSSTSYLKTTVSSLVITGLIANQYVELDVNIPISLGQYVSVLGAKYVLDQSNKVARFLLVNAKNFYYNLCLGFSVEYPSIDQIVDDSTIVKSLKDRVISSFKTEGSPSAKQISTSSWLAGKYIVNSGYLTKITSKSNIAAEIVIKILTVDSSNVITDIKTYYTGFYSVVGVEYSIDIDHIKVNSGQIIVFPQGVWIGNVSTSVTVYRGWNVTNSSGSKPIIGGTTDTSSANFFILLEISNEGSYLSKQQVELAETNIFKDNLKKAIRIDNNKISSDVVHNIILGQSLGLGHGTSEPLPYNEFSNKILGFKYPGTYDKGAIFGITESTYNADKDFYDNQIYLVKKYKELKRSLYPFFGSTWGTSLLVGDEPPTTGFVETLFKNYTNRGFDDIPFYLMLSNNSVGGASLITLNKGTNAYNGLIKDVTKAKSLFLSKGLSYKVGCIMWMQGEGDGPSAVLATVKAGLNTLISDLNTDIKIITGQIEDIKMITYQTSGSYDTYAYANSTTALAQFECGLENNNIILSSPTYPLSKSDVVHLSNTGSRKIGNLLADTYYRYINNINYDNLRPISVTIIGNTIKLFMNRDVKSNVDGLIDPKIKNGLTESKGFFWMNGSVNQITSTTVNSTNNREIILNCSATPNASSIVYYGAKSEGTNVLGGSICEYEPIVGYLDLDVNVYMPVQKIKFSNNLLDIYDA
jgi:hypothetical protein